MRRGAAAGAGAAAARKVKATAFRGPWVSESTTRVFVSPVPKWCGSRTVRQYLSKFGPVVKCAVLHGPSGTPTSHAHAIFASANAARMACRKGIRVKMDLMSVVPMEPVRRPPPRQKVRAGTGGFSGWYSEGGESDDLARRAGNGGGGRRARPGGAAAKATARRRPRKGAPAAEVAVAAEADEGGEEEPARGSNEELSERMSKSQFRSRVVEPRRRRQEPRK